MNIEFGHLPTIFRKRLQKSLMIIEPLYVSFAIFGMINFTLLAYLEGYYLSNYSYFRWLGLVLCSLLFVVNYMPDCYKKYKVSYWYVAVFYCLPFYSFIALLSSYASSTSIFNLSLSLLLMLIILDWMMFLLFLSFGVIVSVGVFFIVDRSHVGFSYYFRGILFLKEYPMFSLFFIWSLAVGTLFSRNIAKNREKLELIQQLYNMRTVTGAMAHELRTPLLTILASIKGMNRFMPKLIEQYQYSDQAAQDISTNKIQQRYLQALKNSAEVAISEIQSANMLINMSLVKFNEGAILQEALSMLSIKTCLDKALARYAYKSADDRLLIEPLSIDNFYFMGNELLFVHVIYNLLKNALIAIKSAGKGKIIIKTECSSDANKLYFLDTAKGIDSDVLPFVFDQFYSRTPEGTGVGLAFCRLVIERFGGKITCESEKGKFTKFVLEFPVVNNESEVNYGL